MAFRGCPKDQLTFPEDRPETCYILEMVAPAEGVVVKEHISWMNVVTEEGNHAFQLRHKGIHQQLQVLGLAKSLATGI